MAFPSQTSGYQRRERTKTIRTVVLGFAMVAGTAVGALVVADGLDRENGAARNIVWLGIAIIVMSVLMFFMLLVTRILAAKKQGPLLEPGTVQLLAVESTYRYFDERYRWELTSEMQIRLDSGHICRGTYLARVKDETLREWWWGAFPPKPGRLRRRITPKEALDAWFHVGASLRCLYNPNNPDDVVVFPFAARGDRLAYSIFDSDGTGQICFESAT